MDVTPLTDSIGADIDGIDLTELDAAQFERLQSAWIDHLVIRIRGQRLNDTQLEQFSARFGPLEEIPLGKMPEAMRKQLTNRHVTVISNIKENGKPIGGLGNTEARWHSDMTYVDNPPPASVLLAVEVPSSGGDTHFANQYAAFAALPAELRARVSTLSIKHDAAHNSIGGLRYGFKRIDDPRAAPGAVHPIVKVHPVSRRPALYLGRREFAYIPELPLADSEALLDELWSYAARPENCWRQRWCVGDVVIWDNRCVLHKRDGFHDRERRLMRRCQVLSPAQ